MSRGELFMQHSQGTFLGTSKTELFYQTWRPAKPARAVIIGMHGLGDHSGGLCTIVKHVVQMDYAWYGFDLRGHGRSPGIRGHVAKWSDIQKDLEAFLQLVIDREPDRPVFLLGHSLGGLICMDYAIQNPEGLSGIIAISPLLGYSAISPLVKIHLGLISHVKPAFILEGQAKNEKLTRDSEILKILEKDPLRHNRISAGFWREIDSRRKWVGVHAKYLHVPLLLLYGSEDHVTPAKPIDRFFQTMSFVEKERHDYKDSRHRPFDDLNRMEVLGHLAAWLTPRLSIKKGIVLEKRVCRTNLKDQAVSEKMMANRAL
jgi:alpha-beta hydrolase superfamily lysophospholipase